MRVNWFACAAIVLVAGVQSTAVPPASPRNMKEVAAPITRDGSVQTMVPAGADLQGYINRARPGDVLLLEPGATYVGNFTLPALPPQPANIAAQFITIRSAADDSHFPANGPVDPSHLQWMPIVRSPNGESALATKPGAHHWRLQWLAFQANTDGAGNIISLGDGSDGQRDLAAVPHHLLLDGLILRGDPSKGQKRGIGLNSADTTIRNSDIRDIKADGQDSQAICGWNGPGPFVIENNYLEAAGENVMFGGADPPIRDLVPTDITIRRNYFTKALEWRGSRWTVKNLLELKNARRVLIESNVFENNWVAAQTGYALLFKPTNQDGRAPWVEVTDVTFQLNLVRHSSSAISINGTDYQYPSGQLRRLQIKNNLFYDIDAARWGGEGRFLKVGDCPAGHRRRSQHRDTERERDPALRQHSGWTSTGDRGFSFHEQSDASQRVRHHWRFSRSREYGHRRLLVSRGHSPKRARRRRPLPVSRRQPVSQRLGVHVSVCRQCSRQLPVARDEPIPFSWDGRFTARREY